MSTGDPLISCPAVIVPSLSNSRTSTSPSSVAQQQREMDQSCNSTITHVRGKIQGRPPRIPVKIERIHSNVCRKAKAVCISFSSLCRIEATIRLAIIYDGCRVAGSRFDGLARILALPMYPPSHMSKKGF